MLDATSPHTDPSISSTSLISDLERQLRVFKTLSSIIDFAYTFDRRGRFLYANQALLDLLGLTLDQIAGKNFLELPYPHDLAVKLQAQIQQVIDTRERLIDVTPYTNPAGMPGLYEYMFNPVFAKTETLKSSPALPARSRTERSTKNPLADWPLSSILPMTPSSAKT